MRQARVGDMGIGSCPAHDGEVTYTTVFVSGTNTTKSNNLVDAVAQATIGISSCGHPTISITGAQSVAKEAKLAHRLGDIGTNPGPYVVVSASSNIDVE